MARVAVVVKETLKKEELRTMAMENLLPLSSTLSIHSGRTGKIFILLIIIIPGSS